MNSNYYTTIAKTPIIIQDALTFVADPEHGATTTFIGSVRKHNLGKEVLGITYDMFEPLVTKTLNDLCESACQHWKNKLKIYIAHYQGKLNVNEISIIIAVSSPHRDATFKACRYLIEEIKKQCPIWKKEHYINGDSEWVKGHALCEHHQ